MKERATRQDKSGRKEENKMKQTAVFNGVTLAYHDQGTGEPLLLIHGFCGSSAYWQKVLPELSKQFRVIAPDLRGHGDSSAPDEHYTMERMADDLARLLDELKIPRVTMLGHSLGGYVTLAFAEKYPDKLAGFGLIHSTAFPDDEKGRENREKGMESIRQHGIEPYVKALVPKLFAPEHLETMPEEVRLVKTIGLATDPLGAVHTLQGMKERPDRNHVLLNSNVPVLLIAGERDQIVPVERTFSVTAPHVTRERIPSAGHMGMLETPDLLIEAIRRFAKKSRLQI
jgi:3-oxoadipate enol-lactonase